MSVHTVILRHSYLGALRQPHAMSGLQRFQTVQGNAILLRDPCKRPPLPVCPPLSLCPV